MHKAVFPRSSPLILLLAKFKSIGQRRGLSGIRCCLKGHGHEDFEDFWSKLC